MRDIRLLYFQKQRNAVHVPVWNELQTECYLNLELERDLLKNFLVLWHAFSKFFVAVCHVHVLQREQHVVRVLVHEGVDAVVPVQQRKII